MGLEQNDTWLETCNLVRGTPTAGVLFFFFFFLHCVIISRRWEQKKKTKKQNKTKHNRERHINTDSPCKKKGLRFSGRTAKFQAPKTPRTDTILTEHLLEHTLIIYVYSHYQSGSPNL